VEIAINGTSDSAALSLTHVKCTHCALSPSPSLTLLKIERDRAREGGSMELVRETGVEKEIC
jgi:hypothetical protein